MTKDVRKYLRRIERYMERKGVDIGYNSAGALTFPTETVDGNDYTVTVNGEEDMVWLTTMLSICGDVDEIAVLRAINELNGTKNPVVVHLEYGLRVLMMTMCFKAEMTDTDVDSMMTAWWSGSEIALRYVLDATGIGIDWDVEV